MTDEIYERLHRRGLIFKEIALGPHYKVIFISLVFFLKKIKLN